MSDDCCAPAEPTPDGEDAPTTLWRIRAVQLAAVSGAFLLLSLTTSGRTSDVAAITGLLVGGWTFVPSTLRNLTRGRLDVGTLMTIAAIGAVLLGELAEAASLAFLFSISEALEGYAMARTRRGLRALLALVPERVTVRTGATTNTVAPADLTVGDVMVIAAGSRVATDGIVIDGRSNVDLSAITGESVPVEVGVGDEVLAAAINGAGVLDVQVTSRAEDSSLARVVHIVEEAQQRKGAGQRLAERVAAPLVPGVMVVAALIAITGSVFGDPEVWISRALVVLVAAAPCAFAISVPVTVVAAIGAAARSGALIKGGAALEALDGISVVALDKTGTLTRNQPRVIEVVPAVGFESSDVLRVAAALETDSLHPLAAAITAAAPDGGATAQDVTAHVGFGLSGLVDDRPARLGKPDFVDPGALAPRVAELQGAGSTVVAVEHNERTLGIIAVRDELRPESPAVVAALRQQGVRSIVMLTGDNRLTAEALGAEVGVDEVRSELLPDDKAQLVTELRRSGRVAMVGDGINDAPALATADVGIAMGAVGSDVAIEAADVALMGSELTQLPAVLAHARRAGRIMRQNLVLSGGILVALVPLAGTGVLGLAAVVAAHEIAELLVIANGVRAGRRKDRPPAAASQPLAPPLTV